MRYVKAKKGQKVYEWSWVTPNNLVETLISQGFTILNLRGYGVLDELSIEKSPLESEVFPKG